MMRPRRPSREQHHGTAVFNVNEAFTGTDLDRDGQQLTYSITGGNTGGAFTIDATPARSP